MKTKKIYAQMKAKYTEASLRNDGSYVILLQSILSDKLKISLKKKKKKNHMKELNDVK